LRFRKDIIFLPSRRVKTVNDIPVEDTVKDTLAPIHVEEAKDVLFFGAGTNGQSEMGYVQIITKKGVTIPYSSRRKAGLKRGRRPSRSKIMT
jgi:hypothetical protein